MRIETVSMLIALVLEVYACSLVVLGRAAPAAAVHVGASLLIGMGLIAGSGRQQRLRAACAAIFTLALPMVAPILLTLVVAPAWRGEPRSTRPTWRQLPAAELLDSTAAPTKARSLRLQLATTEPVATRMAAIIALRRLEGPGAIPMLRHALRDPNEDVRLLAYGVLEHREQQLRRQLDSARSRLQQLQAGSAGQPRLEHAHLDRQLAQLCFELVRQGFAAGTFERPTLEQARAHALAALQQAPHLPTLILLSNIALQLGDGHLAWAAARRAREQGAAQSILAPLQAHAQRLRRATVGPTPAYPPPMPQPSAHRLQYVRGEA